MKLQHTAYLAAVVAIILAVGSMVNTFAQRSGSPSVAVVDVEQVFQDLDERQEVEADITAQIEQIQQWEQAKRNEIKDKQAELGILSQDSPEFKKVSDELGKLAIELQVELQYKQRQVEMQKALEIEGLYRKILTTIQSIAEAQNYDLVLFKDKTPVIRGANQQQLAAMIQVRKLLYSNPSLDITQAVKQRLNAQ